MNVKYRKIIIIKQVKEGFVSSGLAGVLWCGISQSSALHRGRRRYLVSNAVENNIFFIVNGSLGGC